MPRTYSQQLVDVFGSDLDTDVEVDTVHNVQSTASPINNDDSNETVLIDHNGMEIEVTASDDEYEDDDEDEGETFVRNPLIDNEAEEADDEYETEEENLSDNEEGMGFFEGNTDITRDD